MKRFPLYGLITLLLLFIPLAASAFAMPEYATRVGEPCSICHVSAAGGGLRTPRGQAWVAQERPGTVPSQEEALAILGVRLTVNPADYMAPMVPPPPPAPLSTRYERKMLLVEYLLGYRGN